MYHFTCIFHVSPNLLFSNNLWNHHYFVHTQSITEYKFFGNKITDYHHRRLYHHRSYYYRSVVLLFSTNTERIITNINYYVFFVSRTVLLPIRYITNKSYYRIDYNRFVLLLNISIPEKYHYRMVLLPNWVLPNCFITVCYYRMLHTHGGGILKMKMIKVKMTEFINYLN